MLHQRPSVKDCDITAQQQRLGRIGGGVHDRHFTPGKKCRQFVTQRFAQFEVQIDQRLVQQRERRVLGKGTRKRHPLLLSAGEGGGQAVEVRLDTQARRDVMHARTDVGVAHASASGSASARARLHAQGRRDIVGHGERRIVDELLVDHRHITVTHWPPGDIDAIRPERPMARCVETGHDAQHGGLPGSRRPKKHRHRARAQRQVESV